MTVSVQRLQRAAAGGYPEALRLGGVHRDRYRETRAAKIYLTDPGLATATPELALGATVRSSKVSCSPSC